MSKEKIVTISSLNENNGEYIIRDSVGITIGRFYILNLDNINKSSLIRLKFYKSGKEGVILLEETLKVILDTLIKNEHMHKVNIICEEKISLTPFTNIGFQLEGYISNNIINGNKYESSLMFGIVEEDYDKNFIMKDLCIQGKEISIKVLIGDDCEKLLDYYQRNKRYLSKFEPHRDENFYDLEIQRQSLIENYKQFLKGEGAHFGIYKDSKLIGRIRIYNIVYGVFKNGFIGYSIDEKYQGNGYMKEAVSLVLQYAFEDLGLHRIEASTLVENEKSKGVLKACKFTEIGICKDYLYINGRWRDHNIFYRTNK